MKSELANKLKAVLDNMSQDQFDTEWNAITALNLEGPSFIETVEYFSIMQNQLSSYELNSPVTTEFVIVENNYLTAA